MMLKYLLPALFIGSLSGPAFGNEVTPPVEPSPLREFKTRLNAYEVESERLADIGYGGAVLQSDLKSLAAKVTQLRIDLRKYQSTLQEENFNWADSISFSLRTSIREAKRCGPSLTEANAGSRQVATQGDVVSFDVKLDVKEDDIPQQVAFFFVTALDGDPGGVSVKVSGGVTKQFTGNLLALGSAKLFSKGQFGGPVEIDSSGLPPGRYAFVVKIVELDKFKQTSGQALFDAQPAGTSKFTVTKAPKLENQISEEVTDFDKMRIYVPRRLKVGERGNINLEYPNWFKTPVKLDIKTGAGLSITKKNIVSRGALLRLQSELAQKGKISWVKITATDDQKCTIEFRRRIAISAEPDFKVQITAPSKIKSGVPVPFRLDIPEQFYLQKIKARHSKSLGVTWNSTQGSSRVTGKITGYAPENISRKTELVFLLVGQHRDSGSGKIGVARATFNIEGPLNIPKPTIEAENSDNDMKEFFATLHAQTQKTLNEYRDMKNQHNREMDELRKKRDNIGSEVVVEQADEIIVPKRAGAKTRNSQQSSEPRWYMVQCELAVGKKVVERCDVGDPSIYFVHAKSEREAVQEAEEHWYYKNCTHAVLRPEGFINKSSNSTKSTTRNVGGLVTCLDPSFK